MYIWVFEAFETARAVFDVDVVEIAISGIVAISSDQHSGQLRPCRLMIIGDYTHDIEEYKNPIQSNRGIFMNQPVKWNKNGVLNTAHILVVQKMAANIRKSPRRMRISREISPEEMVSLNRKNGSVTIQKWWNILLILGEW